MTLHVVVAEPSNDHWTSISEGIRQHRPDASILRVKDGEQAARFLFHRGLFSDEPETPDLVVLSVELPLVPAEAVVASLRQHPRTLQIPVIIVWHLNAEVDLATALARQQQLLRLPLLSIVRETDCLEREIAETMPLLYGGNPPSVRKAEARGER